MKTKHCGQKTIKELESLVGRLQSGDMQTPKEDGRITQGDSLPRSIDEFAWSTRTYNYLKSKGIRTVGDLARKTEAELLDSRNFGRKSLEEVIGILASMGLRLGMRRNEEHATKIESQKPSSIFIPQNARGWPLTQMPISVRLAGVLDSMGVRLIGDLQGVSFDEVQNIRNCGRLTLAELKALVARVQSGDLNQTSLAVEGSGLTYLTSFVDESLERLPSQKRNILLLRLGGTGSGPMTLEEIGGKYNLTRERIRQISKGVIKYLLKTGGLTIAELLKRLGEKCFTLVCPLTPELFTYWLGSDASTHRYPIPLTCWPRYCEVMRCLRRLETGV
jgi:hypothetical protein